MRPLTEETLDELNKGRNTRASPTTNTLAGIRLVMHATNVEYSFFDHEIETLPTEHLRGLQEEKLARVLQQTYGRNRFITAKLDAVGATPASVRTLDDLAKLPFTTKAELIAAQENEWLSTNCTFPESAYLRMHQTSGTTGRPLRVFDTSESWDWWSRCWGFVLAGAGLTADDRLFKPFSFGPFVAFWAAVRGAEKIGALMIPGGGQSSLRRLELMAEHQVTAMCCTPTYALRLASSAEESGFDLSTIPMRITVHAGEPGALLPTVKARIEEAWAAKCYDHAGASEVGAFSFECQAQSGSTHVIDSEFIVEVVDPTSGRPMPVGDVGELVITNLGRIGFPVIRYRTRDMSRIDPSPCPCGRTFTRLAGGVIGRADDMFVVRGVNIFPAAVENLLRRHPAVDEFRVRITQVREMADLRIEIECWHGTDDEQAARTVRSTFESTLGLRPQVVTVPSGTLPRFELKAQRFFTD